MAMPVRQKITATGAGAPVNLDWMQSPFNASIAVDIVSPATCTYSVQYTDDDLNDPVIIAAGATWYNSGTISGLSASAQESMTRPIKFARINPSAISVSTGAVFFSVTQAMRGL